MTEQTLQAEVQARPRIGRRAGFAAIAAAAAVALGVGGFLATTAAFTDQETVTGNTVGTASLTIGDVVTTPVAAGNIIPGMSVDSPDVITFINSGTTLFGYTVTLTNITTDAPDPAVEDELLGWIPVTITSGGQSASGTLASPPALPSHALAVGEKADVDVTVGLDSNADNDVQGLNATFDLVVTADQIS